MLGINFSDIAWPFVIALAWIAGEFGARRTNLPRISIYGIVGFCMAPSQLGLLPQTDHSRMLFLANMAFGLILFELGYRINLQWLRKNPWITITGLVESLSTFILIYFVAIHYEISGLNALLFASLAMSTSPASIIRVINESGSAGQVTERVLHLSAMNSVLAVLIFNILTGFSVFITSGSFLHAISTSVGISFVSVGIGIFFGFMMPILMQILESSTRKTTLSFALVIILLISITHVTRCSPILAALTFGLIARHRRESASPTQLGFGALGELLTVFLFVFAASTLDWRKTLGGMGLGMILILGRMLTKLLGTVVFARLSSTTWLKGALTGLALAPMSVFVILLLEQAKHLGILFITDEFAALSAMALFMEIIGPILTQQSLQWAQETPHSLENQNAT